MLRYLFITFIAVLVAVSFMLLDIDLTIFIGIGIALTVIMSFTVLLIAVSDHSNLKALDKKNKHKRKHSAKGAWLGYPCRHRSHC
jgi:uncharacterized membrane protein